MNRRPFSGRDSELLTGSVPGPLEWLLLTGNRWAITAGFVSAFFLLLWGLLAVDLIATSNGGFLVRLFASLVGGNITLVTVVISINQLIISREFSSPGDLEEDIRGAIAYRQEVADLVDTPTSPIAPDAFLDFLVTVLRDEAASLRDEARDLSDAVQSDVEPFVETLLEQAEDLGETLGETGGDSFETLLAVLNANFSTDLHTGRQVQAIHGHSFTPEVESQLGTVIEILEHVGVARQYMKTLYFQRTLTALSREILYTGLPALVLLVVTILVLSGDSGPTIDGSALDALVVVTSTVAFAPLAVFFAYVLRIATITRRTGALLPFVMEGRR